MSADALPSGRPERELWVDNARGIAIILIVYGHVARGVHGAGLFPDPGLFSVIDSILYTFHVPLFFFLSGLFCVESLQKRGPRMFIADKTRSILYPYVVWSLLQGMVEVLFSRYTNGSVTVSQVLSFPWAPRAQFWFLYVLFLMFVFAAGVYRRLPAKYYLAMVVLTAGLNMMRHSLPGILPAGYLAANLVFFASGIYFRHAADFFEKNRATLFPLLFSGAVIAQAVFHFYLKLTFRSDTTWLVLPVGLTSVLGIALLCQFFTGLNRTCLARVGRASLSIYVMHVLAAAAVRILLTQVPGIESLSLHLTAGLTAGIVVPLLVRAGIKRSGHRFLYRPFGITGS